MQIEQHRQGLLLRSAGGNVPATQLMANLDADLARLEGIVFDQVKWPSDAGGAEAVHQELSIFIRKMPAFAEDDLLPRLAPHG